MKGITEFLYEAMNVSEAEESIKNKDDFRSYAENKFKEVFGDKVNEEEMKKVIDGLIEQQEKDNLDWGEVVGMLNKSFAA
jgi:uncharacterized protein YpuA (DUF1002 family)